VATVNLWGRQPVILSAISPRLMAVAVGVFLVVVAAVVFGFHYRLKKQEQRTQKAQEQVVASDAAESNRKVVEGEVPIASLGQPPASASSRSTAVTTPFVNAAKTVAHPFPNGTASEPPAGQPQAPAIWYPPPQPITQPVDPQAEIRKQQLAHQYARLQQAVEGPTGAREANASATPTPGDPAQAEVAQLNSLLRTPVAAASAPETGAAALRQPQAAAGASDSEQSYESQNGQAEKRQFLESRETSEGDYLKTTRLPPLSPWVVQRGTVIPAALPHKLVSDLPGDLIAEVTRDVYDSPTQKYVMIPAGSRLVGEYNSSVTYAQNRVQVVWTAIYFPDGSFIDLDRMPSQAADGAVGLKDKVDNHWARVIGGVALSSLFAAGLQVSQNHTNGSVLQYPSTSQVIASAVGTQAAELGQQITSRNLNIQPTLKIRPGEIFAVSVKKDMIFPGPYDPLRGK